MAYKKNPDAVKIVDDTGRELTSAQIDAELRRIDEECEAITSSIREIEDKADKKI